MNLYIGALAIFWILTLIATIVLLVLKSTHRKKISTGKTKLVSEKCSKWFVFLVLFSGFVFMYPIISIFALIIFGSSQYLAVYYLGDILYSNIFFIVYFLVSVILMGWIIYLFKKENKLVGKTSKIDRSRVLLAFYSNFGLIILATVIMLYQLVMVNYIVFSDATTPSGWMEGDSIQ